MSTGTDGNTTMPMRMKQHFINVGVRRMHAKRAHQIRRGRLCLNVRDSEYAGSYAEACAKQIPLSDSQGYILHTSRDGVLIPPAL